MPYNSEHANPLGHVRFVDSKKVNEAFSRWTVSFVQTASAQDVESEYVLVDELLSPEFSTIPRFVVTVDGSNAEVQVTREHPTARVGYLKVAASLVDIFKLKQAGLEEFVDPRVLRESYDYDTYDGTFPGAGLVAGQLSGVDTWRLEVDRFLRETRFDKESDNSLADTILHLFGSNVSGRLQVTLPKCPSCQQAGDDDSPADTLTVGLEPSRCDRCSKPVYLGDLLRTYEEYSDEGSNLTPLTRLMNISERLTTAAYMRLLGESRNFTDHLSQTLFITDGPLALFGTVAPLKRGMQDFISRLTTKCLSAGINHGPLLVGIEKSGTLVEYAKLVSDKIPRGAVLPLSRDRINRILARPSSNNFGVDEYYGRRFIYRTSAGDTLVVSIPPVSSKAPYGDNAMFDLANYPSLPVICKTLDAIRTRLHNNAVIPVSLTHSAASLPLGVGESVLRRMAQLGLGLPSSTQTGSIRYQDRGKRF